MLGVSVGGFLWSARNLIWVKRRIELQRDIRVYSGGLDDDGEEVELLLQGGDEEEGGRKIKEGDGDVTFAGLVEYTLGDTKGKGVKGKERY